MAWNYGWRPYVPVAKRREKARRYAAGLARKGRKVQPVEIAGRRIATTFWGQAWCENLESYSDFANRLPRGRTYVRNGSVVDLQIAAGKVTAIVSGSEIYHVEVGIKALSKADWKRIKADCSQSIDSLMDLLQGRFSQGVMERLTRQKEGLFPQPKEIEMRCSCPDWAILCKHVAAVLYGVGARLDADPELLFLLRKVDHLELINQAVDGASLDEALGAAETASLAGEDLGEMFGIELDAGSSRKGDAAAPATAAAPPRRKRAVRTPSSAARSTRKKTTRKTAKKGAPAQRSAKKRASSAKTSKPKTKTKPRRKK